MNTTAGTSTACQYCGQYHGARCPLVKAIDYYPDGTVKRVEFYSPGDYLAPMRPWPSSPFPPSPLPASPVTCKTTVAEGWRSIE